MGGSGSKNQDYLADIASRYAAEKGLCRTTNQKKLCKYWAVIVQERAVV